MVRVFDSKVVCKRIQSSVFKIVYKLHEMASYYGYRAYLPLFHPHRMPLIFVNLVRKQVELTLSRGKKEEKVESLALEIVSTNTPVRKKA